MNLRTLLPAAVLLTSSSAFAAIGDPCTPDVTDPNTGEVTQENFTERCEGTQVVGCFTNDAGQNVETAQDCAALFQGAPVGTCELYDFGPRCAFADGDACVFASADNPFIPFPCQNADSGCLNGTCSPGVGTCDSETATGGSCLPGGESAFCAPWNQQIGLVCDGWAQIDQINTGGANLTCEGAGVCTGVGDGGDCTNEFYTCAEGDCVGASATSFGTCGGDAPAEGEGEGEGEDEDECEDDSDCGDGETCEDGTCVAPPPACTSLTASSSAPLAALAFFTLAFPALRRRRR